MYLATDPDHRRPRIAHQFKQRQINTGPVSGEARLAAVADFRRDLQHITASKLSFNDTTSRLAFELARSSRIHLFSS